MLFGFIAATDVQSAGSAGFEQDYMWQDRFKKAMASAEQGIAKAQYSVAEMFEKGRGTPKDPSQAFTWYKKAAKQRHIKAEYKLGYFYYKGLSVSKNADKAFKHFKKPANKGNVRAQYYLGKLYETGQGISKDKEKALIWYSRASLAGYPLAETALEKIKKVLATHNNDESKKSASAKKQKKSVIAKATKTNQSKKKNKPSVKKVKATKLNTLARKILNGGWNKRKKPAEFLPSSITNCKKTSNTVMECLSGKLKRNIGAADITYITKAILFELKSNGEFKIAYRNNVLKIKKHIQIIDEEDEEGENKPQKITVKKGWQETEHQLECKIENKESIGCVKNKIRKLKFKSKLKT